MIQHVVYTKSYKCECITFILYLSFALSTSSSGLNFLGGKHTELIGESQ